MKALWLPMAAIAFLPLGAWAAGKHETHLTMDQVPAAVKATLEKESAGARFAPKLAP